MKIKFTLDDDNIIFLGNNKKHEAVVKKCNRKEVLKTLHKKAKKQQVKEPEVSLKGKTSSKDYDQQVSEEDLATGEDIKKELEKRGFWFVRHPKWLKHNLMHKMPTNRWVIQKFQRGTYVPVNVQSSLSPIVTKGMTSASVTDNRYDVEVKALPSPFRYRVVKEVLKDGKEGQRIERQTTTEDKYIISKPFTTAVHTLYLSLFNKVYNSEMNKYTDQQIALKEIGVDSKGDKFVRILQPVLSRKTIISELKAIKQAYTKTRQLPINERKDSEFKSLYHKNGMPKYAFECWERYIKILEKDFTSGSVGFLRVNQDFPIITKDHKRKDTLEFIKSAEKYKKNLKWISIY